MRIETKEQFERYKKLYATVRSTFVLDDGEHGDLGPTLEAMDTILADLISEYLEKPQTANRHTTPEEIDERAEARARIKEIVALKWSLEDISDAITDGTESYAQAMIAFNRLCNEEIDRL